MTTDQSVYFEQVSALSLIFGIFSKIQLHHWIIAMFFCIILVKQKIGSSIARTQFSPYNFIIYWPVQQKHDCAIF